MVAAGKSGHDTRGQNLVVVGCSGWGVEPFLCRAYLYRQSESSGSWRTYFVEPIRDLVARPLAVATAKVDKYNAHNADFAYASPATHYEVAYASLWWQ